MIRRRAFVVGSAVSAAGLVIPGGLLSSGCAPVPPPEEPDPCNVQIVTLRIYADDQINPNDAGRPRPVAVRLYQLAGDLRMQNASYDEILLNDAEVLGEDMMKKDEVIVFPNDLVEVRFERIPEALFLCGAAMFKNPQGQSWKTFYEFPPMPNTPEACSPAAGESDPMEPQAFPETAFFVVSNKIDNGSQYDESMFPDAKSTRRLNLPKRSAAPEAGVGPSR